METASYSLDAIDKWSSLSAEANIGIASQPSTTSDFQDSVYLYITHICSTVRGIRPDGTPAPEVGTHSSKIPVVFFTTTFSSMPSWKALSSYPQQPAVELCCRRIMLSHRILAAPTPPGTMRQSSLISVNITSAVPCFASNHILVSLLFKRSSERLFSNAFLRQQQVITLPFNFYLS